MTKRDEYNRTIRDGEILYKDQYNRDMHHTTCTCERCIADKRHAEIMAALKRIEEKGGT